ncbi:MAG: FecR domain-containing protein [Sedimentisphaerales bacterium]|nr:FecR domain-containing protein [Sedimentisphaerales bacterium]
MKITLEQLNRLFTLLGALREDILTEAEFAELNQMLETIPQAQDIYLDYINLCTELCNLQAATRHNPTITHAIQHPDNSAVSDFSIPLDVLEMMGDYERTAERIELPRETQDSCSPMPIHRVSHNISKTPIITAIASLAALVFLLVYIYLKPQTTFEVATITDSIHAKWSSSHPIKPGYRVSVELEPIQLLSGVLEMETDLGVKMLLEGPAEFRFTNSAEIAMNYGKLYSTVGPAGNGFTVQTKNSRVIDLGTEFGVLAEPHGNSEVHVFRGKTLFITGSKNAAKTTVDVPAGQAYAANHSAASRIDLNKTGFIKAIDSKTRLIWRGQNEISLADVVGGGNGFEVGKPNMGINPLSGELETINRSSRKAGNRFTAVVSNAFINGIFVPDGTTEQIVSSAGHVFKECPPTHGIFYAPASNTPSKFKDLSLFLGDTNYSLPQNPSIFLHANLGITFDLNAFRSRLPGATIEKFITDAGVCDTAPGPFNVDIWVLIDGQVRYSRTGVTQKGLQDQLKIEIQDQDNFLTLIATEGENSDDNPDYQRSSIGCDWVLFGRPMLKLKNIP